MYCSAITTRLLVGMFTPAIRSTTYSCCGRLERRTDLSLCLDVQKGRVSSNATPSPPFRGRHRSNPTEYVPVIRGFNLISSTSAPAHLRGFFAVLHGFEPVGQDGARAWPGYLLRRPFCRRQRPLRPYGWPAFPPSGRPFLPDSAGTRHPPPPGQWPR